ncbi:glucose-1-phosphate adenylyltransferase [Natranaerovirga pectinivora]|uniref:Glucose-1-phosphate adenylyltransferase n=1 Tax=Natranaerovirga pectinivora TaxID=682400 RepID=A0A4R3MM90_9FIRM|nr:glucose-1-phosphate adenylyltransferase [Natranaerovirga pectinivora]TCT15365.1 glucose-1-phosphate adenylyltransferase [Natranaerovirga pectinivora]
MKKEILAMILAGGQGSRLGILTKTLAKPAVYFGGKYRIIDFSLSNCKNSGIDTVGVLTQYKPLLLNNYIGKGEAWGLNRKDGGATILPPYMTEEGGEWYKGTANAIFQNIGYVDMYDPEYVLILSGDHIYTMDYSLMLKYHKEKGADATIAVMEVPIEEASRFGIMNTRSDGRIKEFEEKPNVPKSNLASMGVYIFTWKVLKEHLQKDEYNPYSNNDFGKNIIPQMLRNNNKMFAYSFDGYWKDVGTVHSLWEGNMDLLKETPELDLYDSKWRIYSEETNESPSFIAKDAVIKQSMINDGCTIYGNVENSIIFEGVYIGKNTKVRNSVLMPNVRIEEDVVIDKAIIGEDAIIKSGCYIGSFDQDSLEYNIDVTNKDVVLIGEKTIIDEALKISINSIICEYDEDEIIKETLMKKKGVAI